MLHQSEGEERKVTPQFSAMQDTTAPARPGRKHLVFYGMLLGLIVLVPLGALEFYLRLPKKSNFVVDTRNLIVPSEIPGLGYRLARNYNSGPFRTDEFGFRRGAHSDGPVKRSILLLGDSVSFAGGVAYDESFASLVENQLSQKLGYQVAVQNSGTPGYNSVQELLLLKDLQKSIKPNLVVLQFCMNDYQDPVALASDNSLDATSTGGGQVSVVSLLYRSRAIFFLKDKVKDLEKLYPERFPAALHYIHYIHKHAGWQRAKDAILEMAETTGQMGARFVLVIFPVEQQLRIGDHGPQDDLVAFAKSHGIEVLDLYPSLAAHWREHLFFDYSVEQHVVDKVHLNKRGHELAAGEITAAILSERVLRSALR
jgi:lysophospholipase L1-like esterase